MLQVLVFELQVHPFHTQIIDPFLSSLWTLGFRYEDINLVKDLLIHEFTEIWILSHGIWSIILSFYKTTPLKCIYYKNKFKDVCWLLYSNSSITSTNNNLWMLQVAHASIHVLVYET